VLIWTGRRELREVFSGIATRIASGDAIELTAGPSSVKIGESKLRRPPTEIKRAEATLEKKEGLLRPDVPGDSAAGAALSLPLVADALLNTIYVVHRTGRPRTDKDGVDRRALRVYLDADSEELLGRVERVIYHLHPSFADPDREVRDPDEGFELRTRAYGEFNLSADVYFKGQAHAVRLYRYLNF
jgi:hypothetical protein